MPRLPNHSKNSVNKSFAELAAEVTAEDCCAGLEKPKFAICPAFEPFIDFTLRRLDAHRRAGVDPPVSLMLFCRRSTASTRLEAIATGATLSGEVSFPWPRGIRFFMLESKRNPVQTGARRRLRYWIGGVALVAIGVIAAAGSIIISHAEPILRARVIETLSTKFKSQVELDAFHVSLIKGVQVSGSGLRIFGDTDPNNHEPGVQPIIGVAEFRFRTGMLDLFRSPMHVDTIHVSGLQINLPPREQRGEMKKMSAKGGKITIVIDRLDCDHAQLIINTLKPGKLPLEFDIERLKMTSIGPDAPMAFEANLTNPKPVGNIISSGSFGPWNADSPRDTSVSGTYSFNHADLGTIKGLGGILSSTGSYSGILDKIVVDGKTDTPDFRLAISGRAVPLHTDFHAIVDGTSGDAYLEPVKARILNSWLE